MDSIKSSVCPESVEEILHQLSMLFGHLIEIMSSDTRLSSRVGKDVNGPPGYLYPSQHQYKMNDEVVPFLAKLQRSMGTHVSFDRRVPEQVSS